jgi:hypothetical protein
MKNYILLTGVLFIFRLNSAAQDTTTTKIKEANFSIGTFSTSDKNNLVKVNPYLAVNYGDYYFENRYNYEAANSSSINVGKRIFKKIKYFKFIPITGLIFGSFNGVSAELQSSYDYGKWAVSIDNQYCLEYNRPKASLYFNWNEVRYKLTPFLGVGISTFFENDAKGTREFDRGITVSASLKKWSMHIYAFNYEKANRLYWLSLLYNFSIKLMQS